MSDRVTVTDRSLAAWERARRVLAGGVSSPVRAFRAVGGTPRFIARGEGAWIEDVDGNRYLDYVGSWGPLILGHAHPRVVAAVQAAAARGASFGAPTEAESELAERVIARFGGVIESLRFVSSGTEATMSALRLARGFTGRDLVVKCDGCYHGHADGLLVSAGSGPATFGSPTSPGVPAGAAGCTLSIPYGDAAAFDEACRAHPGQVAAIILEPVVGNMGVVAPPEGYLDALRTIADEHGALLILDEVMTGFRLDLGGATTRFKARPDLVTLGKVIGGGLPVGAYGGRREIMAHLSPDGAVYQAGTLSGNPLAMAAGIATLDELDTSSYTRLEAAGARLAAGIEVAIREQGAAAHVARVGSMITLFFTPTPVRRFEDAMSCDREAHARFFHAMLSEGVYLPPSQLEAAFVSLAHDEDAIDATVAAVGRSLARARG
jgi:glutamate-1-semialdehyde 2,1-aminomutase